VSLALQYGVPLRDLVNKFSHLRFEPAGFTTNRDIPMAKSLVDYIFRYMATKFLDRDSQDAVGIINRQLTLSEATPVGEGAAPGTPPAPAIATGSGGVPATAPSSNASVASEGTGTSVKGASTTQSSAPATEGAAAAASGAAASATESASRTESARDLSATQKGPDAESVISGTTAAESAETSGLLDGLKVLAKADASREERLNVGQAPVIFDTADSPACTECGSIMVRNGSCYKCINCGATSGCS
jgi:ribonucleoside-diphosphate reductase alpha chain